MSKLASLMSKHHLTILTKVVQVVDYSFCNHV